MDGLDMNMDMGMDLDLSLSSTVPQQGFAPIAPAGQLPHNGNQSSMTPQNPFSASPDHDGMSNMTPTANRSIATSQPPIDPNEIGGGPLPAGFGMQALQQQQNSAAGGSGSTLTDFTKRRNWSQRVLEELRDFLHILTPEGRMLYCSPSTRALTGYDPAQLVGRFIGDFIHPDDSGIFICEFNEAIASGNPLRFFYRFKRADDSYTIFEAHGHPHLSSEVSPFTTLTGQSGMQSQGYCRGFFMMSRPYPTKNAGMLDSFLEHKIENERLMKRIAELRREEAEENEQSERQWKTREAAGQDTSTMGASDTQRTEGKTGTDSEVVSGSGQVANGVNPAMGGPVGGLTQEQQKAYRDMPPPAKPTSSNIALTRQNLDEALAGAKTDSINDKMARYEGLSSHYDGIEMLTGLRYRDGERSQGISTGDTSPHLIRGDVGIAIAADKDRRESKGLSGAKKVKVADEYVCTDCGTLDSPEWRKGPNGPKTLCNACGCEYPAATYLTLLTCNSAVGKEGEETAEYGWSRRTWLRKSTGQPTDAHEFRIWLMHLRGVGLWCGLEDIPGRATNSSVRVSHEFNTPHQDGLSECHRSRSAQVVAELCYFTFLSGRGGDHSVQTYLTRHVLVVMTTS